MERHQDLYHQNSRIRKGTTKDSMKSPREKATGPITNLWDPERMEHTRQPGHPYHPPLTPEQRTHTQRNLGSSKRKKERQEVSKNRKGETPSVNQFWEMEIFTPTRAQMVRRLSTMRETRVPSLGQEGLLEKEMATHSSVLAWKIPWTEEPGRLHSMGSQRVEHNWATSLSFFLCQVQA